MKRQEAQRRILDLLVQASDAGGELSDEELADELEVDRRIVQGNLQLLQDVGYVTIRVAEYVGSPPEMSAELTPKGYVLLHEPGDDPTSALPLAKAMLEVMETQVAGFGELYAPPYLIVQLEEQRQKVAALEAAQAG